MAWEKLPKGYVKAESIHLEKDKANKRKINLTAMMIAVAALMAGHLVHPFDEAASALLSRAWVLLALMGVLGYVSELGIIGQSAATAHNMCWLVAALYLFSAVLQFVGLGVIYNLDKKTTEEMAAELTARHNAE